MPFADENAKISPTVLLGKNQCEERPCSPRYRPYKVFRQTLTFWELRLPKVCCLSRLPFLLPSVLFLPFLGSKLQVRREVRFSFSPWWLNSLFLCKASSTSLFTFALQLSCLRSPKVQSLAKDRRDKSIQGCLDLSDACSMNSVLLLGRILILNYVYIDRAVLVLCSDVFVGKQVRDPVYWIPTRQKYPEN